MYVPYRETEEINFKFPWERNTARGFGISLAIFTIFLILVSQCSVKFDKPVGLDRNDIPLSDIMISFGDGDGTGVSKGNLSQEGAAHKGAQPSSNIADASIAASNKYNKNAVEQDPTSSSNLIAKSELSSSEKNSKADPNGNGVKNIGSPNGTTNGTGIGVNGNGPGSGLGLGDIEWGGGGNRIVLQKKLPKYPAGTNTNAQIRIKFVVSADGTVINMFPLQKGDPVLERAAMDALRQWRFNPLRENKEMFGIITFTFRVS